MLALRQKAARVALRPTQFSRATRRYASGGHHHEHASADEPLGTGLIITVAALPAGCLLYFAARRGENGEEPALTRWLRKYQSLNEVWLERNTLHSQAVQQAAADKLLFLTAPRSTNYELRFPEIIQSHSPRNVVAGSLINIDAVTERYRKQHYEEEERKAKKLAAKQQAEAAEKA
ncbi:NADH:ubiquinone reductase (H(+)-translocating) [Scedosporium apiospermum]|uniref:NADH:ubiquinone reductase (H(+)-translocating) n=1 Tax=Pseudallescheria apiosperma TaxID=563466 RepID=A0A084GAB0_PSEDA|nr:NADH:ubiquinone reductase (H(+)-translocating) [Scedosporium apiospermum]KEZ44272.1 NADH:ubiquinone reductase (H(+)-translocating) [Scedosporium apiospermum]